MTMTIPPPAAIERLTRDLKASAATLGLDEIRYLVDLYYEIQTLRIGTGHQERQLTASGEPHELISWTTRNFHQFENNIKSALDVYTDNESTGMGTWAKSITGIGPVLSAGLIAHIDITKAPTVGHIWRYAGLDPTSTWERKTKRPWNAQLKTLCYKIGESFVKFQNHPQDHYGRYFRERRELEASRNTAGQFTTQAAAALGAKTYRPTTEAFKAYSAGRLPDAQLHARARRYTVKLFLAHWHGEAYRRHYRTEPPRPYVIEHLGHAHEIAPPI